MSHFLLKQKEEDTYVGRLVEAKATSLTTISHLENWLIWSPGSIINVPALWIGKKTSAPVVDTSIYPDLLGVDDEGNLLLLELIKGKAPRDVMAKLFEYAAWANTLHENGIREMAAAFFNMDEEYKGKTLDDVFCDRFNVTDLPLLNRKQVMFVLAEKVPPAVAKVCRFLRTAHEIDVNCFEITIYETDENDILIHSKLIVGEGAAEPFPEME